MLAASAPSEPPPHGDGARWCGPVPPGLLEAMPTRGRRRRWVYAAAADEHVVVGAAVVHAGLLGLGTVFAFAVDAGGTHLFEPGPGRAGTVDGLAGTASCRRAGGIVAIEHGALRLDVPVAGGRLVATLEAEPPSPVSLLTGTPRGGWNATTKAAGHRVHGHVATPAGEHGLRGAGWTDGTDGRQDAHTTWRWAAGAGGGGDTPPVGLQASTGMNGLGPGEDLVWWDGVPQPLEVDTLAPLDEADATGTWRLAGPGWELLLEPAGARAATEGVGPVRSRYAQPVGLWRGTLPGPDGRARAVQLHGVAEDHEARW